MKALLCRAFLITNCVALASRFAGITNCELVLALSRAIEIIGKHQKAMENHDDHSPHAEFQYHHREPYRK